MKFLCRNCKAKYQIADEKVVGRTLRMTCQQCGEPIVVRSNTTTGRSGQISRPLTPATLAGAGPAAPLGADFQRQIAAATQREVMAAQEEWHVAINDVPVGPMRRDEVARKVALNAIDRESLAWREGMDDWLPIKHIPELLALFPQEHAGPATRPAPPSAVVTMSGAPPAPMMAPPVPPPAGVVPAQRVDMAPVGSRQMMNLDEYSVPIQSDSVAVAPIAPEPAASSGGKQLGWGPMFALVSGGAFILAAGAFLGVRVLAPQPPAAPPAVATAPAEPTPKSSTPAAEPAESPSNVIELDVQPIDGQKAASGGKRPTTPAAPASGDKPKKQLTAEQREMLARMGGGLDSAGPNLRAPSDTPDRVNSGGQLTAQQLSAVVQRGRKNLQRCYETALRGSGSSDTVRLDVEIEVSPNGNVTLVRANGKGLPGMDDCITRSVKMWRFPASGEVTQTRFPVVFQPGA